jgi:hypothetical protein
VVEERKRRRESVACDGQLTKRGCCGDIRMYTWPKRATCARRVNVRVACPSTDGVFLCIFYFLLPLILLTFNELTIRPVQHTKIIILLSVQCWKCCGNYNDTGLISNLSNSHKKTTVGPSYRKNTIILSAELHPRAADGSTKLCKRQHQLCRFKRKRGMRELTRAVHANNSEERLEHPTQTLSSQHTSLQRSGQTGARQSKQGMARLQRRQTYTYRSSPDCAFARRS